MNTIKPSPISPIEPVECFWINGYLWYIEHATGERIIYLDARAYAQPITPSGVPYPSIDLLAPIEQQTCCHGSQFVQRHETALRGFGAAVVGLFLVVFWSAVFALLGAVARWLR